MNTARTFRPAAGRRRPPRLLRRRPCAAGRQHPPRPRRARHRRPQRHGQDDALQRDHGPGAGLARQREARGRGGTRPLAQPDRAARRRLRAAGPPHLAVALGRRASAPRRPAATRAPWTVERIYETFPRLAERRRNGGAQLSGGEQQMLAISRSLLANPRLLVMDEPTEGLAPVIVEQVEAMLRRLADEGEISVLLVEQNLGVAMDVAARVAVMVNGRIARVTDARPSWAPTATCSSACWACAASDDVAADARARERAAPRRRRGSSVSCAPMTTRRRRRSMRQRPRRRRASRPRVRRPLWSASTAPARGRRPGRACAGSAESRRAVAALAKRRLCRRHVRHQGPRAAVPAQLPRRGSGVRTTTVDLSTGGKPSPADVGPAEVARLPSQGPARRVHERPRHGGHGHGRGVRALHRGAARRRRPDLGRRLRRHGAGHAGDAPAADRRAEA